MTDTDKRLEEIRTYRAPGRALYYNHSGVAVEHVDYLLAEVDRLRAEAKAARGKALEEAIRRLEYWRAKAFTSRRLMNLIIDEIRALMTEE